MRDTAKAVEHEISRKYYGGDDTTSTKGFSTASGPVPEIKSFVELPDGQLVDEEIVEELAATIKATSQAMAAARQLLEA